PAAQLLVVDALGPPAQQTPLERSEPAFVGAGREGTVELGQPAHLPHPVLAALESTTDRRVVEAPFGPVEDQTLDGTQPVGAGHADLLGCGPQTYPSPRPQCDGGRFPPGAVAWSVTEPAPRRAGAAGGAEGRRLA